MKKILSILLWGGILLIPKRALAAGCELNIIPDSLALAIKTGNIHWEDLITFVLHLICFLVFIAGGVAVILLMIGGYKFIFGSIMEDKESGVKTIKNTLLGLVVVLLSWIIVDTLISFLTTDENTVYLSLPTFS
ncbi:hypothetical protein IPN35_02940 [Candidatus Peregrinibacteria bacterium]|nr:MAG: hypothetical protein IPN35_02940 [Candidatus Peregrinibacteria bacterium]